MIYVARHGKTDWNAAGKIQSRSDIPLNETGREQARALAAEIAGISIDVCYSSPLSRAMETCEIATGGKYDIIIDDRLIERNYGELEGTVAWDKVKECHTYDIKGYWNSANETLIKGTESLEQLRTRIFSFFDDVIRKHPNKNIFVVSHSGAIRMMRSYFGGVPAEGNYLSFGKTKNCELVTFDPGLIAKE